MASGFVCFTALYNFKPQQYGEIELKVGDVVCVKIPYDIESWVEGENKRTKQHGLLPGTYLKELPEYPDSMVCNGHEFQMIVRITPVCCALCSDYIWGEEKTLYLCLKCNRCYHLICAKDSPECTGERSSYNDEDNPYDVLTKNVDEWSIKDVLVWMAATNLFQYAHLFKKCSIDGKKLLGLSQDSLIKLGINDDFHQNMILACIKELTGNAERKKTRKSPGMKTGVKDSRDTHSFVLQTFTTMTWCHECGHLMFGLVRQGLQCTKCELVCHRKCTHYKVLRVCPGKPTTGSTKPLYIPLPQDNVVPVLLKKCIGAVESRDFIAMEIYKTEPTDSSSKYALRKAFYSDDDDVDMKAEEWIDPLCPSAVLLSYLNELPNSIIPSHMYDTFINIAESSNTVNDALETAFASLPPTNAEILKIILLHLNRVVSASIPEKDIGEVFGPIIIRPAQEYLPLLASNLDTHTKVVQLLLALTRKQEDVDDEEEDEENGVLPPVPPRPNQTKKVFGSLSEEAWYWPKAHANDKLAGCCDGSFLVRDSKRHAGYTLIVRKDRETKQIRIYYEDGKYGFARPHEFDSVPELIEYYRTRSLNEYSQYLDVMLKYPVCREDLPQADVTKVKDAAKKLKDIGAKFNEKSCLHEELSDKCFMYEQELTAIEEAIAAQQELINFLEEQKNIFVNFKNESPSSERASLDLNYSLVENRYTEQKSGLESLETEYLNISEKRRTCEAEMNMLKPDLWELQHKKEKYMLFLEERNMKPEEIEILAGITDFALYEFPMTDEEMLVDLSPEYWLFGELDRETIKNYLDNTPDGTFLVRESSRNRGMKAVSIMFDGQIKHFCIEEGPEGFGFAEGFNTHPTLQTLVEYYHRVSLQMHNSGLATTLRMPVRWVKNKIPAWRRF